MLKQLLKSHGGLQGCLFLLSTHRKLQARVGLARSKQLHSTLTEKELPPIPKSANAFQDEQNSQTNSSGANVEVSWYDYVIVTQPPPPPVVPSPNGRDLPSSSLVPTPRQVPDRSTSNEPVVEDRVLEISHREEERIQMREYIGKLHERIGSMKSEIAALNTSLCETESTLHSTLQDLHSTRQDLHSTRQDLHSTRQDLIASRILVASEGSVGAQFLIKMTRDLNGSIDKFAYEFLQSIPEATLTRKVSRSGLEALVNSSDHARGIITFTNIAYQNRATVGDFIQLFVQYALCTRLIDVVFSLWVPGMPRDKSEMFHNIYNLVHQREAQVGIKMLL